MSLVVLVQPVTEALLPDSTSTASFPMSAHNVRWESLTSFAGAVLPLLPSLRNC